MTEITLEEAQAMIQEADWISAVDFDELTICRDGKKTQLHMPVGRAPFIEEWTEH